MNTELQSFILKNAVDEIKKACPKVSNTFIFADEGEVLAKDDDTKEQAAACAADALNAVSKRSETIGGFESATFYNASDRLHVFRSNDYNLALVGSEESEGAVCSNLARILVPTVLKVIEKSCDFSDEEIPAEGSTTEEGEHDGEKDSGLEAEEVTAVEVKPDEEQKAEGLAQTFLPEPPVTQLLIENVYGIVLGKDTARIDSRVIQQWVDLYGDLQIEEVEVETLNGQSTRCKFKPIKDAKHYGKGIIQLPQKIQQKLQTSKGELVIVKPVVE